VSCSVERASPEVFVQVDAGTNLLIYSIAKIYMMVKIIKKISFVNSDKIRYIEFDLLYTKIKIIS
jgi:hypothetical protein